jgi:hypothetical protein
VPRSCAIADPDNRTGAGVAVRICTSLDPCVSRTRGHGPLPCVSAPFALCEPHHHEQLAYTAVERHHLRHPTKTPRGTPPQLIVMACIFCCCGGGCCACAGMLKKQAEERKRVAEQQARPRSRSHPPSAGCPVSSNSEPCVGLSEGEKRQPRMGPPDRVFQSGVGPCFLCF